MDNLTGVTAFVRTAEALSFVGASRHLGVSPSAVGNSVARLEQHLGVRLLQRSTRRLSLPIIGYRFLLPILPGFAARYPDIDLDLDFNDRIVDVIEGGFDAAIRSGVLSVAIDGQAARAIPLCALRLARVCAALRHTLR